MAQRPSLDNYGNYLANPGAQSFSTGTGPGGASIFGSSGSVTVAANIPAPLNPNVLNIYFSDPLANPSGNGETFYWPAGGTQWE